MLEFISNKLVKLINDKAPALKFSGLAGEEWEEIATDIMNNYITEDKTIAESFKDSLDRDWFVELGIIAATGLTTNITIRGLRELSKRGATSQEKAIFNSLKEEDKIRMLNELDEVEKQQFNNIKEQYKQDLKTITNYTDEQIEKGMEFHDKMFLYGFNYFSNDNLSINEWNKEYGFKILESVKGELKGGKELNQAINRNIDLEQEVNVLDIKNLLKNNKNITKAEAKKLIWNIAENGEQIKTLSEPWVVDILNNRVKKNHLLNSSLYSNFTNRQYNRHNIELNNLRDIINNSVLIERVDNIKQDKKPNVEEYFYFYTPITDGNKTYLIKSVAEKLKGEKDLKNVHLYDIIENQLNLSGKADTSLHKLPSTNSADVITIKQILSNVKDINGKNALESYMEENGLNQLSTINSQLPTPNNSSLSTFNSQLSTPLGQYDITNRIMYLSKQSNITTFQHEMMHWWRQTIKTFADVGNKQAQIDMDTLNNYVGATTDSDWTREQEEVFARAWEQYLRRGIAPNKQLQSTFDKIREWFIEIYKTAKDIMYNGKPIELNKNIIEYFDRLMNLDTIQQQDIETNYNIQYDKLKNEIDEARNILYQEEPDFTEEEINAILRERFKEQLTPLEELQYRIEQENKKTLKQKVNEIFNTYQYDKQEFKDLVNRVKTEIKDISKTIKNLKNGDVKIAEIDNQDLSIEDIIELRNIANKRLPRRPMTLTDFVKRKGGVWEGDKYGVGELQRIKGLVHKNPYMKVRDSQSGKINFVKRATNPDGLTYTETWNKLQLFDVYNAIKDKKTRQDYFDYYGQDKIESLVETLTSKERQTADVIYDAVQDYERLNEFVIKHYNKDLKRVENYWPKTSEHQQSIDILELNNGTSLQFNSENGTYGSFIKDRVQGSVKPITTNAYTKATGHINEVEYLLNVAEIYKQNKEIITNNDLSSMIKQKFGDNIFKNYSDIIANQSFSTKQKYISLSERLGQTLLNNYAAAKLGANPTSFARQLGAFTNYGIDTKNGFYKEVVNTLANFPQAWNYMKNLDWVQERLHSGSNIELSRILESKENIINLGKHLNVISKALNKLDIFKVLANLSSYGDLLSVVVGGYSQIQANIKNGMAEAEAQLQCRKSTFRTQQSNLKASQSNLQNNTGFIKRLFTMFTSATNQMKRNVADAMVQYSKGEISKGRITEIITNYIFLQAANYVILGYLTNGAISAIGGMLGFDNDDEREKDKHTFGDFTLDIAQQILETITIDFPIARQLTSAGFETVKKKITGKDLLRN